MYLAVDIGNSAIKFGLFEGESLTFKFSIPTKRNATCGEIQAAIGDRLNPGIRGSIVCSVVPEIEASVASCLRDLTGVEPTFVNNSFDFGLKIDYEPLDSLGTDRLVAAFSAVEKYGAPSIVCSLGTATTIDVVNADREFLGGIIAPGLDAMAEALHLKAARLPDVEIEKPENLLGNSTVASISSGVYNGYVKMVEGLIVRIQKETGIARVIGTGGNAPRVSAEFAEIMTVEPDLVLKGLRVLTQQRHD